MSDSSSSLTSMTSTELTASNKIGDQTMDNSDDKQHVYRKCLPSPMLDRSKFSIWSILKQCVDKELYRFTIPIVWNEPLSLLQRMAENMRYSNELLDKAVYLNDPIDRMKYVAGFLVSCTSIHNDRLSKPFNPLLGETYEYVCSENKFRVCCEQVSHHPPISAYYSESIRPNKTENPKWKYYGSVNPHMRLNFLSASVEAFPEGIQTVEFPDLGEVYTWHNLKINAHNLVVGKLWFEYHGKCEIINHKLNIKCVLEFKPYSWFTRQLNRCEGYILDSDNRKVALLNGKWDEFFFSTNDTKNPPEFIRKTEKFINHEEKFTRMVNSNSTDDVSSKNNNPLKTNQNGIELIWKSDSTNNDKGKIYPDYFNFTSYTLRLNELYEKITKATEIKVNDDADPDLVKNVAIGPLPITDSRFRPDMRLYEQGKIDIASSEKNRLEEKQRETQRKVDQGDQVPFKPLWFDKGSHSVSKDEDTWIFNNNYWKRDYSNCPHIY